MRKELVREIKFGKGLARIKVTGFTTDKSLDGWVVGKEVIITQKIEIVVNGKVVESDNYAQLMEYNDYNASTFKRAGWDINKVYSRVGRAVTEGDVALEIKEIMKEMKEEVAAYFNEKTEEQKEEEKEIEKAKYIVAQAEREGVENLMTFEQIKAWKKRYNDLYNEGGEGYIPEKISKESYEEAVKILQKTR